MAIEYLGLSEINGPLVVLEGVKNAAYEEIVEFTIDGKEKKLGRIVEVYEDKAWDVPSTVSATRSTVWDRSWQTPKQISTVCR